MQQFPHHYKVQASSSGDSSVSLSSEGLPTMLSAPPAEFGGPGDQWSPESLLVAAVADCFILGFKAIARASKFEWNTLTCEAEGILDRPEKVTKFTEVHLAVVLNLPVGAKHEMATRLLEKAEHTCLITNSLSADTHLKLEITEG